MPGAESVGGESPVEVARRMAAQRKGTITLAPEAGSQRMRDVINKNISETDMLATAERAFERGWDRLKLYFMTGLPTEADEDVVGIAEVGGRVRAVGRRLVGRRVDVVSRGEYLVKGAALVVEEVAGNRIVVREKEA